VLWFALALWLVGSIVVGVVRALWTGVGPAA
jgi:hypothetical protein